MSNLYLLYGLRVASDIPIPAPACRPPCDLEICRQPETAGDGDLPAGTVLAELALSPTRHYALIDRVPDYYLRFSSVCEARIQRDLGRVDVHPFRGVDPGMLPLILTGNLMALILGLAGEPLLHASAVVKDGKALAFVGNSGMGKSTLACLAWAAGARPLADDLLRLQIDGEAIRCHSGPRELRLRPGLEEMTKSVAGGIVEPTADGRLGIRFEVREAGMPRLAAIIVPKPDRCAPAVELRRLSPAQGLWNLCQYPRVLGWRDPAVLRRQFERFGEIAGRVPIWEADIPWGPPFAPDLGQHLLSLLDS